MYCVLLLFEQHSGKMFETPLSSLIGRDDDLPSFLLKLFETIEVHGLGTEGLYRKAGSNATVKDLASKLDTSTSLRIVIVIIVICYSLLSSHWCILCICA